MDKAKCIDIALQWKGRIGISNHVGKKEFDGHIHILNSEEASINNEYTIESIFCMH